MSSEEKIHADASQPATLLDGDKSVECYTLGEAVLAETICPPNER